MDIKSTSHFFLYCPLCADKRITRLSTLNENDCKLIEANASSLIEALLFGNSLLNLKKDFLILNASIDYVLSTERFEKALLLITTTKYSFIYYFRFLEFIIFVFRFSHFYNFVLFPSAPFRYLVIVIFSSQKFFWVSNITFFIAPPLSYVTFGVYQRARKVIFLKILSAF